MNLCKKINKNFGQLKEGLIILNKYYIESRYPPEVKDYSREECKKVLDITEKLTQFIIKKIL